MTLRIYKNEYEAAFLSFIRNGGIENCGLIEESEKVMTIAGNCNTLLKIQDLMFKDDETIKRYFENYMTSEDMFKRVQHMMEKQRRAMQNEILNALNLIKMYGRSDNARDYMSKVTDLYLELDNYMMNNI